MQHTCIITTKRTRWSHKTYCCTHKTHSMVSHCTFHNTFHKTCIAHPHKTHIAPSITPFHKTCIAHITKRKLCLSQNVQLHLPQNVHCTFHNTFHKTYIAHLTKRTLCLSQNVMAQHMPDVGRVWRCQRPMGLPRQPGCFVMGSSMCCHGANPGFMVEVGFGFCFLSANECPHPARYVFFVAGRKCRFWHGISFWCCVRVRVCVGGQPELRWVRGEIRDGCDEWKLGLFWFLCEC